MTVIIIINIIIIAIFFLIVYRINLYVVKLEEQIKRQIEISENLFQSLKDVVAEGMLENDGRLKKYKIQNEKNFYYNGTKLEERNYEL